MAEGMRERILEAALRLIYTKGISNLRIENVSDYLKISRKTIYNHFSSKKKLILAAVDLNTKKLGCQLDELASRKDMDFLEKIERILKIAFDEFRNWENSGFSDGSYFWEQSVELPIPALRQKVLELVNQLLKEGLRSGVVREDLPVDVLPYYYINMVEGAVRLYEDNSIPLNRAEFLKESLRISLKGVLTEEAASRLH